MSVTYVKLEGLHGSTVASWHWCIEAQHLLDDAVKVLEAADAVKPQFTLAQTAIMQKAAVAKLLTQLLQHCWVPQ